MPTWKRRDAGLLPRLLRAATAALLLGTLLLAAVHPAAPAAAQQAPPAPAAAPAPTFDDAEVAAFIEGYVASAMEVGGMPGGTLVVMRRGATLLARGYGYADTDRRRPVSVEETLFRQGSVSKLFVWVLAMQLAEEGLLDLDRDVGDYLGFRIGEAFGAPVTMRHLMTHTAGFADRARGVHDTDGGKPLGEVLAANVPDRVYPPGTVIAYSNYGAALAGHVVERLRGKPFAEVARERILEPLGMRLSTFAQPLPDDLAARLAAGVNGAASYRTIAGAPAGALAAPAGDMARFTAALLEGGGPLLKPGTLDRMMRVEKALVPGSGFGLGFSVQEHRGVRWAGHGGSISGYISDLVVLPEAGLAWHLSFSGRGRAAAAARIRDGLVRAVIDRFLAPVAPESAPALAGASTAADLEGYYASARRPRSGHRTLMTAFSILQVVADGDGTLRTTRPRRPDGGLARWHPAGPDRFVEEETGALLVAERDAGGRVVRIASPLLNSGAALDRAEATAAFTMPVLGATVAVLAVSAGLVGLTLLLRYLPRPAARAPQGLARWSLPLARAGSWLILLTLFGWVMAKRTGLLQGAGGPVQALLVGLSILCAAAALAMAVDAVAAWRDPTRGTARRVGAAVAALAALVAVRHMAYYDFLNFSSDF